MAESASALHLAVADNDPERLTQLLSDGAMPDLRDDNGMTPLHWAARIGALECVRILVGVGAQVDARDTLNQTPLYLAIAADKNVGEVVMALRGAGADPFARTSVGGTPYDLAHLWEDEVAMYFSDLPLPRDDGRSPQLVPNIPCYATRRLIESEGSVGAMDRMEDDGAWFFSLGTETQEQLDDPANTGIYSLQTIATLDPSVIDYLNEPTGTRLIRSPRGGFTPG